MQVAIDDISAKKTHCNEIGVIFIITEEYA